MNSINDALREPGPHTAESLAERLPSFPLDAIEQALEALTAQGVLERNVRPEGVREYRYVAPERYVHADRDVIVNPGARHNPRRNRR